MGVLIDGKWQDSELPQERNKCRDFGGPRASSGIASRPTDRPGSKPSPAVIIFTWRTRARGPIAR